MVCQPQKLLKTEKQVEETASVQKQLFSLYIGLISYTQFSWEMAQKTASISSLPIGILLD